MKKAFTLWCAALLLTACSGSSSDKQEDNNTLTQAIDNALGDQIQQFDGRLDDLLTLEIAANNSGLPAATAEKSYQQTLKNPFTHSLSYRWDNGRKKMLEVGKRSIEVTTDDFIEVGWVKQTDLETFKRDYHTPTAEELAQLEAIMNNQMEKAAQEGKISKDDSKLGSSIGSSLAKGLSYTDIPNVGNYAVWNNKDKSLCVFYKGLQFIVTADVSNNEQQNQETAIKVAKDIIAQKL